MSKNKKVFNQQLQMQQPSPKFVPAGVSNQVLGPHPQGSQIIVEQTQISGPIPSPEIIAGYEKTLPGSADRIIKMAEKEQEHRHRMERTNSKMTVGIIVLGQIFGVMIGLSGILGGLYLVLHDKALSGFSAFFVSLGSLVAVFLYDSRNKRRKSDQQQPK